MHSQKILKSVRKSEIDPGRIKHKSETLDLRYYNVSMECIDFTPVHFDTIKQHIKDNKL